MIVWQAIWDASGKLYLWCEDSTRYLETADADDQIYHPFCCSSEDLEKYLEDLDFEGDEFETITLALPSLNNRPIPSKGLVRQLQKENVNWAEVNEQEWQVSAACFPALVGLGFLSSVVRPPYGMYFDDSLRYWQEATKFLLQSLAKGRYLPSLIRENGVCLGAWRIAPSLKQDHSQLETLNKGMPHICLCLDSNRAHGITQSEDVLESFLNEITDTTVRYFLKNSIFRERLEGEFSDSQLSLTARWLRSLVLPSEPIDNREPDLQRLEKLVKKWHAQSSPIDTSTSTWSTTIKVIPPPLEEETTLATSWSLELGLSSPTRTKFLPLEEFWQDPSEVLEGSPYTLDEFETSLFRDLGVALEIVPVLKRALEREFPTQFKASALEAYTILRDQSNALEQVGINLISPEWWGDTGETIGLHVRLHDTEDYKTDPQNRLGVQQLLKCSWEVVLGDNKISLEEFRQMTLSGDPLFRVGNRWMELRPEAAKKTLEFLEEKNNNPELPLLEAFRLALGHETPEDVFPVLGFRAEGRFKQLLEGKAGQVKLLEQPEGFMGELRPYQLNGLSWLSFLSDFGLGACLADDMGLGKTIQLLALLLHERAETQTKPHPTLLIVPMSILENWVVEAARFTPNLKTYLHHGTTRAGLGKFQKIVAESDVVITTYSLLARDEELFFDISWGRIALDEAQNIKNLDTKQTKAVRRLVREQMVRPEGGACHRIALTGTPLENRLRELWSIFDFLNPGYLGTYNQFRRTFAGPIENARDQEALARLNALIRPFILRRLKGDPKIVDELPEKLELEIFTGLTAEQSALYQEALDKMLPKMAESHGFHRKGAILATITRLKQICNHPSLYLKDEGPIADRSSKLQRLEELLDVVLAEGDRVLIFTQFAQMGAILQKFLSERFEQEVLFLHGAVSKANRDEMIRQFQSKKSAQLFVLSLKAGGFGINLTAANQVIHYDQWWNPAVEAQATDRAHRIGQTRRVQVRKLICKGTLEERISEMSKSKKELAESVVSPSKYIVTELSLEEIKKVLQLSARETF